MLRSDRTSSTPSRQREQRERTTQAQEAKEEATTEVSYFLLSWSLSYPIARLISPPSLDFSRRSALASQRRVDLTTTRVRHSTRIDRLCIERSSRTWLEDWRCRCRAGPKEQAAKQRLPQAVRPDHLAPSRLRRF